MSCQSRRGYPSQGSPEAPHLKKTNSDELIVDPRSVDPQNLRIGNADHFFAFRTLKRYCTDETKRAGILTGDGVACEWLCIMI